MLSSVPVLGNAFATSANARTRTELVFFVTVNAEEPPALTPVEVDGPEPRDSDRAARYFTDPMREGQRVERIDVGGV